MEAMLVPQEQHAIKIEHKSDAEKEPMQDDMLLSLSSIEMYGGNCCFGSLVLRQHLSFFIHTRPRCPQSMEVSWALLLNIETRLSQAVR